jgi:hypothetical protein
MRQFLIWPQSPLDGRLRVRQAGVVVWRKKMLLKPEALIVLEQWFNTLEGKELISRYDRAIAALEADSPDAWVRVAQEAGLDEDTLAHFRRHWLGDTDEGYWSSIGEGEAIAEIRRGFADAMRTARDNGLPMNYAWVAPEGLAKDTFAVDHVAGPNGVIALLITAAPERLPEAD